MFRIKTTIKNIWNIIRIESLDFRYQITYSLSSPFRDTESMMTARIMLIMHQLEKGLSHNSRRANWEIKDGVITHLPYLLWLGTALF